MSRVVWLVWSAFLKTTPVVQQLYERAHEYANLANRSKPGVTDVLAASDDYNFEASEIYRLTKKSKKRKRSSRPVSRWPSSSDAAFDLIQVLLKRL